MSINMEEQNVKKQKKKEKSREIDMLHEPFQKKLIVFALPIAASSMLQQLFNAADTAVVGRFADADALAAVGANVLLARLTGEGKEADTSRAAYTALALAFVLGIFGAAVLRARGDSRRPFVILSISGGLNLLLNLALVVGCKLGVAGVAIATDLSSLCAAGMVLLLLFREERFTGFCLKHGWSVLKIGIPAALQGAVFCFANLFVQAATTFTSQNVGAGKLGNCKKILYRCLWFL